MKKMRRGFEECEKGEKGCMCGRADDRRRDTSGLMGTIMKAVIASGFHGLESETTSTSDNP